MYLQLLAESTGWIIATRAEKGACRYRTIVMISKTESYLYFLILFLWHLSLTP